jgi:hypothetical protein
MEAKNYVNQDTNQKLEEIYVLLKTIQMNQENILINAQKNHATTMRRINKLQEYNQIADMTNQIFELRITGIEENIKKIAIRDCP